MIICILNRIWMILRVLLRSTCCLQYIGWGLLILFFFIFFFVFFYQRKLCVWLSAGICLLFFRLVKCFWISSTFGLPIVTSGPVSGDDWRARPQFSQSLTNMVLMLTFVILILMFYFWNGNVSSEMILQD